MAKVAYQARNEPDGYGYVALFSTISGTCRLHLMCWKARVNGWHVHLTLTKTQDLHSKETSALRTLRWCEAKGDGLARHKVWDAFGLSERMLATRVRAQYVRCLRLVGDVEVRTPRNMPVELEYQVVVPAAQGEIQWDMGCVCWPG